MKHNVRITSFLLLLFVLAQLVGLATVASYVDASATMEQGKLVWKDLPMVAGVQLERPDVAPQYSILYITFAVIFGTILILLIARLRTMLLWKLWFTLAVVLCMWISFGAFISPATAFLLALAFGLFKVFRPNVIVQNFTELFIYGGLATIFVPILTVFTAYILLLILSVYDAYAVWRSKHMITLATFQTQSGIFAGLLLPYQSGKIRTIRAAKHAPRTKTKRAPKHEYKTAVLGGGDIGFPLIFSGTILVSQGILPALIVTFFASAALLALLMLSEKNKFYPAMPFLTAGCTIGYLIGFLL